MSYPTPNEHGVFVEGCMVFEHKHKRSKIQIRVIEESEGSFVTGHDFAYGCGNFHGSAGGPSNGKWAQRFPSLAEALEYERQHALKHFGPDSLHPGDSMVSAEQREVSKEFTRLLQGGWPFGPDTPKVATVALEQVEQPSLFTNAAPAQLSLF